jgi:hypothetical protein
LKAADAICLAFCCFCSDVLKARLGTAQRTGSNASSTSMNQAAAGPWGAAAQRQALPLAHIMQQVSSGR